jgi:branched-chain amino acid transport system substrate-binding protein
LEERVASVKHESRMRFAAALLAFCVLALSSGARAATEPFTIYAIDAVTGSGAFQGKTMAQAERMYAAIANKAGGINGQPIEMQIVDDQSNPRIAVQLANEIMTHHPAVILGPTIQATCNAVGALATAGPVIYCQSPGLNPPKDSFVFSSGVAITRTIPIAVRYARLSGARRMAFLIANDATGARTEQILDTVLAQPENRSVQVVAREHFEDTALGIEAQLARIKAANADYLYVSAAGTPFQTLIRGLRDAGKTIPVTTSAANMHAEFLTPFGDALPKRVLFNGPVYWGMDPARAGRLQPAIAEYLDAHRAAGIPITPDEFYGWDSTKIVISALQKLGTTATAEQLRSYIANLHGFYGISGEYDFRTGDQHGLGDDATVMLQYDPVHQNFYPVSAPGGTPLRNR